MILMDEANPKKRKNAPLQGAGIAGLLGKKSLRATLNLHPAAIERLSIRATQLGIKQKSLFDYLLEDEDA
jgi:hypothetical protein